MSFRDCAIESKRSIDPAWLHHYVYADEDSVFMCFISLLRVGVLGTPTRLPRVPRERESSQLYIKPAGSSSIGQFPFPPLFGN